VSAPPASPAPTALSFWMVKTTSLPKLNKDISLYKLQLQTVIQEAKGYHLG